MISCDKAATKQQKMDDKTTIIEMVLFNIKKGVTPENAKKSLKELNEIVSQQNGFISRKTAISKDGQYLDIVYWTDLAAAQKASENIMSNPKALEAFNVIAQEEMIFKHFEIFNTHNKK